MRFLVDNQLPPGLVRFLNQNGHDALHVCEVGLHTAHDHALWAWAVHERRVLISKDQDFVPIAHQTGAAGQFLWVRLGNCRLQPLIEAFDRTLPGVIAALQTEQRVVVLA